MPLSLNPLEIFLRTPMAELLFKVFLILQLNVLNNILIENNESYSLRLGDTDTGLLRLQ